MAKILSENLDAHPYTGKIEIKGKLRIIDAPYIRPYFNGTENYEQVKNVTIGKVYDVFCKEGYGDMEDIYFINDAGEPDKLADFFFEEVPTQEKSSDVQESEFGK